MSFIDRTRDEKLIDRISRTIRSGNLSHAYIIEGDSVSDKEGFAKDFAKAVMCLRNPGLGCRTDDELSETAGPGSEAAQEAACACVNCRKIAHGNFEDLYVVRAEYNQTKTVRSVRDADIEELQNNLIKKPAGERNIAIICDADTMTIRAQNRFLKTLEEPPAGTLIMLLAENSENLLDTVRSRSIVYRLNTIGGEGSEKMKAASKLVDQIIEQAKFFDIKEALAKQAKTREEAKALLDAMERVYRNILVEEDRRWKLVRKDEVIRAIELIEEAKRDIDIKVSTNYALRNLVMKLI